MSVPDPVRRESLAVRFTKSLQITDFVVESPEFHVPIRVIHRGQVDVENTLEMPMVCLSFFVQGFISTSDRCNDVLACLDASTESFFHKFRNNSNLAVSLLRPSVKQNLSAERRCWRGGVPIVIKQKIVFFSSKDREQAEQK